MSSVALLTVACVVPLTLPKLLSLGVPSSGSRICHPWFQSRFNAPKYAVAAEGNDVNLVP